METCMLNNNVIDLFITDDLPTLFSISDIHVPCFQFQLFSLYFYSILFVLSRDQDRMITYLIKTYIDQNTLHFSKYSNIICSSSTISCFAWTFSYLKWLYNRIIDNTLLLKCASLWAYRSFFRPHTVVYKLFINVLNVQGTSYSAYDTVDILNAVGL